MRAPTVAVRARLPQARWALLMVPALGGGLMGLGMAAGLWPETLLVGRFQASLAVLAPVGGLILSALGLGLQTWRARTARQVDQRLQAERAAQAAARQRFLHRLSHEFRNPLTAARAGLANLEAAPLDADARRSLVTVRQQVERLARLVDSLRQLADLETAPLALERVDPTAVVAEAVAAVRALPAYAARSVTVQVQKLPWPPGPVLADRDLVALALFNLLDNALKFSPPDRPVEVRLREEIGAVVFEVADAGCGIAPADLPHVTEELYRGQGTASHEGSGLGLALVERVARRHRGTLLIRSRPGQGTVAALRLPLEAG